MQPGDPGKPESQPARRRFWKREKTSPIDSESASLNGQSKEGSKNAAPDSCRAKKDAYHECFNRWYMGRYLKGEYSNKDCEEEWEAYQACVAKRIKDAGLGPLLEAEGVKVPYVENKGL